MADTQGPEIPEAVAQSHAVKAFVCNLMTEANESLDLSASDHVRVLNKHAGASLFNYALLNRTPVSPEVVRNYAEEGASQILADAEAAEKLGPKVILGDYLEECDGMARHDTDRVARDLLRLASEPRRAASAR